MQTQNVMIKRWIWCSSTIFFANAKILVSASEWSVVQCSHSIESLYLWCHHICKVDDLVVSQRLLELDDPGTKDEFCKIWFIMELDDPGIEDEFCKIWFTIGLSRYDETFFGIFWFIIERFLVS